MAASILIVDDDQSIRDLLRLHLSSAGYEVHVAEDAIAAGYMVLRAPPDLIITDINMPDINGLELVSFVRRNPAYARVPVLIVSTEGSERDREKGLALGADAYLVKPFEPDDLQRIVEDLLDRDRGQDRADPARGG